MAFNVDLSTVRALENHRGIGYMLFLSSILAPSFLAYALLEPAIVHKSLVPVAAITAALGLLVTSASTLGSFMILFDGPTKNGGLESAGTRSLILGISLAFVVQCGALGHALVAKNGSFNSYARTTLLFTLVLAGYFFIASFYKDKSDQKKATDNTTSQ